MIRTDVRGLVWAFFLISAGGLLLHIRIHPVSASAFHWVPVSVAAANTFVLPLLFCYPRTVPWAYLFTWVTVVIGTVGMAYHSVTAWNVPVTVTTILLFSTLPDILILWAKIFIAHKILRTHWPEGVSTEAKRGCAP